MRVRIVDEAHTGKPYRIVRAMEIADAPAPAERAEQLVDNLRRLVFGVHQAFPRAAGRLLDVIAQAETPEKVADDVAALYADTATLGDDEVPADPCAGFTLDADEDFCTGIDPADYHGTIDMASYDPNTVCEVHAYTRGTNCNAWCAAQGAVCMHAHPFYCAALPWSISVCCCCLPCEMGKGLVRFSHFMNVFTPHRYSSCWC